MNFIKKFFEGKLDESCHLQLRRFSKGTFDNRALIDVTVTKKNVKIKTSAEFANDFAFLLGATISSTTHVTGGIVTTRDLQFPFDVGKKQFAGVKTYLLDHEFTQQQLLDLFHTHSSLLFLLSFKTDFGELKTKVKSPKSGKPGKGDEEPKADFCTFTTSHFDFVKEFIFESSSFSHAIVKHTFVVTDIIPPKNETDPARIRELAQRQGTIKRFALIDGKEIVSEKTFLA